MRDFYDIYILTELYADRVDRAMLAVAIKSTSTKRGSQEVVKDSVTIHVQKAISISTCMRS